MTVPITLPRPPPSRVPPSTTAAKICKQHRRADQRIDASALGADENPRRPIEGPRQDVGDEFGRPRAYARRGGCILVAADCVDRDAERRVPDDDPDADRKKNHHERSRDDAGDRCAGEQGRKARRDIAAGRRTHEKRDALHDEQGRERDHDRLDFEIGDEEAVERARGGADRKPQHACEDLAPPAVGHRRADDDIGERHDGAGAEVEIRRSAPRASAPSRPRRGCRRFRPSSRSRNMRTNRC